MADLGKVQAREKRTERDGAQTIHASDPSSRAYSCGMFARECGVDGEALFVDVDADHPVEIGAPEADTTAFVAL